MESIDVSEEIQFWRNTDGISNILENWSRITTTLLKNDNWATVAGNLLCLPTDIVQIFDSLENRFPIKVGTTSRKRYYQAFFKSASGFGILYPAQVEFLILSNLALEIDSVTLKGLIADKLQQSGSLCKSRQKATDVFDFELFAALVVEILLRSAHSRIQPGVDVKESPDDAGPKRKMTFPLSPDSNFKTMWDLLCLQLLLYCSFEVPYTLAFDSVLGCDSNSPLQITDLLVNIIFMIDITISFISSYEKDGVIVRNFRAIAINYMHGWFWPDLAGSFPFDSVLCLFQDGSVQGTILIRFLRFTRALRLVRAIKFLAKLKSLRNQEAFEGFSRVFGVIRAAFLLSIAAHMLGCLFTALADDEAGAPVTWITYYNQWTPDEADNWTRCAICCCCLTFFLSYTSIWAFGRPE